MLVINRKHGYSSKRKYIQGRGFVDSLSSTMRGIGSYISQNKDLLAKPLLGAAGDLAAFALAEGGKSAISHIINKKRNSNKTDPSFAPLDPKAFEILQSLMTPNTDSNKSDYSQTPATNIIGNGIKRF